MAKVNKNKYNNGYSPMNYASNVMSGVSAGSALGPAGMIIGGGLGLIKSISEKNQLEDANRNRQIQTAMSGIRTAGQNVLADYNMNLMGGNTGVPGFNKGKSSLGKNAFVSPDEIVRNGVTGDMTKVPGSYSASNIDTIPASISPLDSVFSAASSQTIPFGKSTPADIAKKIKKVSDRAKTGGPIDRRTADLMEKQLEKIDMYTALSNYVGADNKFNTGKPGNMIINPYGGGTGGLMGAISSFMGQPIFGSTATSSQPINPAAGSSKRPSATRSSSAAENKPSSEDLARRLSDPIYGGGNPDIFNGIELSIAPDKVSSDYGLMVPEGISSAAKSYMNDNIKTKKKSELGADALNYISGIGSLAPAMANVFEEAEIESPIYNQFINPMSVYNIKPQLDDVSRQSRISRYNQSVIGGGAGMAYGSSLYGTSVGARSNIYDAASKFHAEQLAGYADRFNAASLADSNEFRRVRDINARNRAAAKSIRNAGLSQLSNFSQIREQMANAKRRDEQQLAIYGLSNIDKLTPEVMEKLNKILPGIFGSLK